MCGDRVSDSEGIDVKHVLWLRKNLSESHRACVSELLHIEACHPQELAVVSGMGGIIGVGTTIGCRVVLIVACEHAVDIAS